MLFSKPTEVQISDFRSKKWGAFLPSFKKCVRSQKSLKKYGN